LGKIENNPCVQFHFRKYPKRKRADNE